jgi:hypothetical protein
MRIVESLVAGTATPILAIGREVYSKVGNLRHWKQSWGTSPSTPAIFADCPLWRDILRYSYTRGAVLFLDAGMFATANS